MGFFAHYMGLDINVRGGRVIASLHAQMAGVLLSCFPVVLFKSSRERVEPPHGTSPTYAVLLP